jgi:hypothetical protein
MGEIRRRQKVGRKSPVRLPLTKGQYQHERCDSDRSRNHYGCRCRAAAGDAPPQSRAAWARLIAYWLFTLMVAFEMAAAALWGRLDIEYVRVVLTRLGYPLYFHYIIAAPRIPCALALLAPRFPRLKEWAYAGAFFIYAGAAASHLLSGIVPANRWWARSSLLSRSPLSLWLPGGSVRPRGGLDSLFRRSRRPPSRGPFRCSSPSAC